MSLPLCENCKKREGKTNYCEGDGRVHHHGMVHVIGGGLKWLCNTCADKEKEKWQLARAKQVINI